MNIDGIVFALEMSLQNQELEYIRFLIQSNTNQKTNKTDFFFSQISLICLSVITSSSFWS